MSFIALSYEQQRQIAIVTLNRPQMKHAFNTKMAQQLRDICYSLQQEDVRVVIFTSSTTDAFCSGADLKERKQMDDAAWQQQHSIFEDMFQAIAALACPTIAVLHGYALAGGFELALNMDIIIAAENTKVGLTEVQRGIMPGGGGARLLPKRVPLHIAKEWLCTGGIIDAKTAQQVGLFNKLTTSEQAMVEAMTLAKTICANAPLGVKGVKKVANSSTLPTEQAIQIELQAYNTVVHSQDRLEGMQAFNDKRQPNFIGR